MFTLLDLVQLISVHADDIDTTKTTSIHAAIYSCVCTCVVDLLCRNLPAAVKEHAHFPVHGCFLKVDGAAASPKMKRKYFINNEFKSLAGVTEGYRSVRKGKCTTQREWLDSMRAQAAIATPMKFID